MCKYRICDNKHNVRQLKYDKEPLSRERNNKGRAKLAQLALRTWLWLFNEKGHTSAKGKISNRLSHCTNNDIKQALNTR